RGFWETMGGISGEPGRLGIPMAPGGDQGCWEGSAKGERGERGFGRDREPLKCSHSSCWLSCDAGGPQGLGWLWSCGLPPEPMAPRGTPAPGPHSPISASLEDVDLWTEFYRVGTEMVITKSGRRMFPQCKIRLSGLVPYLKYVVLADFVSVDNFRYKWAKDQWEVAGKAEPQLPGRSYIHPDSPAYGSHWMKEPVSFHKMKLTNNTLDQHGHVSRARSGPSGCWEGPGTQ
uniref:T-box domain-containing protein n=1 Tax=Monodelphis domestica TaxID=13616 RepID=A0A5F8HJS8_MONDO